MRRANAVLGLTGVFLFMPDPGRSQAPAKLEFEVASVRASGPLSGRGGGMNDPALLVFSRTSGGPGTADPERLTISRTPLRNILLQAYRVRADQISGPAWLDSDVFDIAAKIAPGITKEQAGVMLQNLLVERFKITLHHATKEDTQAYELTVSKKGTKLKEVAPEPNAIAPKPGEFLLRKMELDRNGFPIMPEGRMGILTTRGNGLNRITCRACSIAELIKPMALDLAVPVGSPVSSLVAAHVADKTGLTGKYDFHLEYSAGPGAGGALQPPALDGQDQSGPDLFSALERQLGLKLEKTKLPLDVLVIDHIERVPAEN